MRVACETQRTHAWFQARLGLVTASESCAALARLNCEAGADCKLGNHGKCKRKACGCDCHNGAKLPGEAAERCNYKMQLVAERITGKVTPQFVSTWMKIGSEFEDDARAACEVKLDTFIDQTGFILHPRFDFFGASPDGLLPDNGVLEIKVPAPANHLKYLLGHLDPREEYGAQMLGEIICCEADYCVFASFNPDFPPHLKLFTKRYERADILQLDAYEREIEQFNSEVEAMVSQLSAARTAVDRGLDSSPSPEELAAQDMRDLEATWAK